MKNIVNFPISELQKRIEEVEHAEFDSVAPLLIFALENRLSARPIVDLLGRRSSIHRQRVENLRSLLEWCNSVDFRREESSAESGKLSPNSSSSSSERAEFFNTIAKIGAEVGAQNKIGRSHRYWYFRPAWDVSSALWDQTFGEFDPASVIALYASSFFKKEGELTNKRTITLTSDGVIILEWLVQEAAATIGLKKGSKSEQLVPLVRSALATACRLEDVFDFSVRWSNAEFLRAVLELPLSIASFLIKYWAERVDFATELSNRELHQQAVDQARFMGACLLKYLNHDANIAGLVEVPRLPFIGDDTLVRMRHQIECIEIEVAAAELGPCLESIGLALYRARDTLFGGVFPFTFHEARDIIGPLFGRKGFWLADFAYYDAEEYDPLRDRYRVYSDQDDSVIHADESIRRDRRAQYRYEAYRDALASMEEEGLSELGGAWWAFFLASQVLAFPGFGLSAKDLRSMARQTAPMMANPAVVRAIEFAKAQEGARSANIASRIALGFLRELNPKISDAESAHVIHLGVSPKRAEVFLRECIGFRSWAGLHDQSRKDLIEVEQWWCLAAPEYGAGRSDWGSLIGNYSRPVEAETRTHLRPLLEQLCGAGLCEVSEWTLGGCAKGIRDAHRALRRKESPIISISEDVRIRVESLQRFFGQQARFLESYRNRADHGNREQPIKAEEFLKWRKAIFEYGLFAVILGHASEVPAIA